MGLTPDGLAGEREKVMNKIRWPLASAGFGLGWVGLTPLPPLTLQLCWAFLCYWEGSWEVTWRDGRVSRKIQSYLPGGELTSPWRGRVGCRRSSSPLCSEKSRNTGRARLHLLIDLHGTSMRASPKSAPKSSLPFQQ